MQVRKTCNNFKISDSKTKINNSRIKFIQYNYFFQSYIITLYIGLVNPLKMKLINIIDNFISDNKQIFHLLMIFINE